MRQAALSAGLRQSLAAMLGDLIATRDSAPGHFGQISDPTLRHHPPAPPLINSPAAAPAIRAVAPIAAIAPGAEVPPGQARSLFGEILEFMLAPMLLLWPLTILLTLFVARSLADEPYDAALRDRTLLLSQQVRFDRTAGLGVRSSVPLTAHDLLTHDGADLRYQVVASDDQVIFGNSRLPAPALYDFPDLGRVKFRTVDIDDKEQRIAYTYVPVLGEEDLSKPVLVQVSESLDARNQLAARIIKGVIFPQFVILPLAAGLVWFGLSRGLRPLHGLRDRIRNRRPDDLSPIDPRSAPDEIVPLVESFNELLLQLGATMDTQRRFIADAAHQIKTPLAGIRMQAELAMREADPHEQRRSLSQLARSSERASHVINQLLALARAESMGERTQSERLDLEPLVREVLAELTPLAIADRIDMGFEGTGAPVWIQGNPVLLGELVQNLVANAIHYTPRNGLINIRLHAAMGAVALEVEDNGPGIPASEREAIFERFYRLRDRPATTEGAARGSGLGLAIVREIARLHGGQVTISDGAPWPSARGVGRGACFVVRLPLPA